MTLGETNNTTRTYDQVPVADTFVYIPILETLKFMCRNADICRLLSTINSPKNDLFEDFCDGNYFKTHPLFSKHQNALQIQLYYDDFESANPLGSKKVFTRLVQSMLFSETSHQK